MKTLLITIVIISLLTNIYSLFKHQLTEKKHGKELFQLFLKDWRHAPHFYYFYDEWLLKRPTCFKNKYFKKLLTNYFTKQPKFWLSGSNTNKILWEKINQWPTN